MRVNMLCSDLSRRSRRRSRRVPEESGEEVEPAEQGSADGGEHLVGDVVCLAELVALGVSHGVCEGERDGDDDQDEGEELELQDGEDGEDGPHGRDNVHEGPEDLGVNGVDVSGRVGVLEHPDGLAQLVGLVPPAQAHEEPARDVFHVPEVCRKKEDDGDKEQDVVRREEHSEEVDGDRRQPEQQEGQQGDRVRRLGKLLVECLRERRRVLCGWRWGQVGHVRAIDCLCGVDCIRRLRGLSLACFLPCPGCRHLNIRGDQYPCSAPPQSSSEILAGPIDPNLFLLT